MTADRASGGWQLHPGGETAQGDPVPVIADGDLIATVSPIWSDEDGVRVSVDWHREIFDGITALGDMSPRQANELACALQQVADTQPPLLAV